MPSGMSNERWVMIGSVAFTVSFYVLVLVLSVWAVRDPVIPAAVVDVPVAMVALLLVFASLFFLFYGFRIWQKATELSSSHAREATVVLVGVGLVLLVITILNIIRLVLFVDVLTADLVGEDRPSHDAYLPLQRCALGPVGCSLVGEWLPELLPSVLFLMLLWERNDEDSELDGLMEDEMENEAWGDATEFGTFGTLRRTLESREWLASKKTPLTVGLLRNESDDGRRPSIASSLADQLAADDEMDGVVANGVVVSERSSLLRHAPSMPPIRRPAASSSPVASAMRSSPSTPDLYTAVSRALRPSPSRGKLDTLQMAAALHRVANDEELFPSLSRAPAPTRLAFDTARLVTDRSSHVVQVCIEIGLDLQFAAPDSIPSTDAEANPVFAMCTSFMRPVSTAAYAYGPPEWRPAGRTEVVRVKPGAHFCVLLRLECPLTSSPLVGPAGSRVGETRDGLAAMRLASTTVLDTEFAVHVYASTSSPEALENIETRRLPVPAALPPATLEFPAEEEDVEEDEGMRSEEGKLETEGSTMSSSTTTKKSSAVTPPRNKSTERSSVLSSPRLIGTAVLKASDVLRRRSAAVSVPLASDSPDLWGVSTGSLRLTLRSVKQGMAEARGGGAIGAYPSLQAAKEAESVSDEVPADARRPRSEGCRVSRWYSFHEDSGDVLVVEEDLRESNYAWDVPARMSALLLHDRLHRLEETIRELGRFDPGTARVASARFLQPARAAAVAVARDVRRRENAKGWAAPRDTVPFADWSRGEEGRDVVPDEDDADGAGGYGWLSVLGGLGGGWDTLQRRLRSKLEREQTTAWLWEHASHVARHIAWLAQCAAIGAGGRGPHGETFKRSIHKASIPLAMIPTNLHVQEMRVKLLRPHSDLPQPVAIEHHVAWWVPFADVAVFDDKERTATPGGGVFPVSASKFSDNPQTPPPSSKTDPKQSPSYSSHRVQLGEPEAARAIASLRAVHDRPADGDADAGAAATAGVLGLDGMAEVAADVDSLGIVSDSPERTSRPLRSERPDTREKEERRVGFPEVVYDTVTVGAFAAHVLKFHGGGAAGIAGRLRRIRSEIQRETEAAALEFRRASAAAARRLRPLKTGASDDDRRGLVMAEEGRSSSMQLAGPRVTGDDDDDEDVGVEIGERIGTGGSSKSNDSSRNPARRKPGINNDDNEEDESGMRFVTDAATPALATLNAQLRREAALQWTLERRMDVVVCQASTALVTAFARKLRLAQRYLPLAEGRRLLEQYERSGFLLQIESLLSTGGHERGMLEDFVSAASALSLFRIRLRPPLTETGTDPADWRAGAGGAVRLVYEPGRFVIEIRLWPAHGRAEAEQDEWLELLVPKRLREGHTVEVHAAMFTLGINEQQTLDNMNPLSDGADIQDKINRRGARRLQTYYNGYEEYYRRDTRELETAATANLPTDEAERAAASEALQAELKRRRLKLERLRRTLLAISDAIAESHRQKNIALLQGAAHFTRMVHGSRLTACKSAKDRTSMSVTLEQARILEQQHGLASLPRHVVADAMRRHGVRRANAEKNIGKAKYAINDMQALFLPLELRPPPGTGGGGAT